MECVDTLRCDCGFEKTVFTFAMIVSIRQFETFGPNVLTEKALCTESQQHWLFAQEWVFTHSRLTASFLFMLFVFDWVLTCNLEPTVKVSRQGLCQGKVRRISG